MERKRFSSLGEALERYLADSPLSEGLRYSRVCNAWDSVVGQTVVPFVLGKQFRDGEFTVRLNSSVLRMQLNLNREDIRLKMNEILGSDMVKSLNLR